jgi:DNA-directed RNA polymerase specialized sigma24 family protein
MSSSVHRLSLTELREYCLRENAKSGAQIESDPRYGLEIFRRALELCQEEAQSTAQECYQYLVPKWWHPKPGGITKEQRNALERDRQHRLLSFADLMQELTNDSFMRLFAASCNQRDRGTPIRCTALGKILTYLKQSFISAVIDRVRTIIAREKILREEGVFLEPLDEEVVHQDKAVQHRGPPPPEADVLDQERVQEIWNRLDACAHDDRERRLIRLRWIEGYTPAEIVTPTTITRWGYRYPDVKEIYDILKRIRKCYIHRWLRGPTPDTSER